MRSNRTLLFVLSLLLSFSASQLNAQCDRVAWVAGEQQGCGVKLIDLNTGELMLAIDGASALNFGQTITFSADYVDIPPACSLLGLPAISLTCISTNLPCEADFDYVVDDLNPYQFSFGASVFDPSVQDCNWDFGDGTEMTGVYTQHTFASEGYYDVCLTIMDNTGCEAQICKEIFVSELNPGWCGYDMQLTAVGTNLQGKVFATSSDVGTLQNVQWFNSKTNQVIGQNAQLDYALPSYGNYLICAQYQVETPDGNLCSNTICRQLTVAEPGCASPLLYNYNAICPPVYAPVCGCDGVAYGNECEAMAAGVTGWWEGECSSIGYGNCSADLSMEVISGGPGGFEVEFTNLASGDYNYTQLDFGDGTPLYEATNWDKVTHIYQQGGIYRTNLTVWKNSSCVQSVTRLLVTDAVNMNADMMPVGTDYVLPGDANGDGRANMYDLLNVGVGYNELGSPRPNASVTWSPQFAPNWPSATGPGVNMKHVDCDGNGIVNEFDPSVIQQNYSPLDTNEVVWNPLAPEVWLEFEEDTLYLDPNNPQTLEISADLMVGTPSAPVFGLYGMALAMKYPEYVNHDPGTDYDDDSFFGFSNYLLWLPRDNYSRRQLDMGFSQKQGNGKSGYGRIANITFRADFIIIIDIVDRASTDAVPFTVPIKGLKGVDAQGNKKDLNVAAVQDTVWIKMVETTSTQAPQSVQDAVQVYPNPASGAVQVYTGKLQVEKMQLIDPLGRVLQSKEANPNNAVQQLLLDDIAPGLYQLRLQTNQGLVEKKLMVH